MVNVVNEQIVDSLMVEFQQWKYPEMLTMVNTSYELLWFINSWLQEWLIMANS